MSFFLQSSLRRVTQTFVRCFQNKAALKPVPPPQGDIATPQAFLSAIGRSAETKVPIDSWGAFWHTSGYDLKKAGVAVKDRRYILWCMEKCRQNIPIEEFAHDPRPTKKIRGRGARIQHVVYTAIERRWRESGVTFEPQRRGHANAGCWTDAAKLALFSCNKAASM